MNNEVDYEALQDRYVDARELVSMIEGLRENIKCENSDFIIDNILGVVYSHLEGGTGVSILQKTLVDCIDSTMNNKGISVEFSSKGKEEYKDFKMIKDLSIAQDNGYIQIGIMGDYLNKDLFLTVMSDLLKNGGMILRGTSKMSKKNEEYLASLIECINK